MHNNLKKLLLSLIATESQQNLLVVLAIVLVTSICFANGLQGQFLYDDHLLIENHASIKSLSSTLKLFQENAWGVDNPPGNYRPVNNVTYALNYAINGLNTFGYHLVNLLIHLINSLFIYWLCNYYSKRKIFALFSALLFAAHPVHSEAVTAIYGRPEILASFFLLAAWITYLKSKNHRYFYIISLLSYFLSLLCKESGIVFIGILWLGQICTEISWKDKLIPVKKLWGYLLATIPYMAMRIVVTKSIGVDKSGQFFGDETFFTRLYTMSLGYLKYFEILIFPTNLCADYDYNIVAKATSLSLIVFLALILILAIIIIGFWQINKNPIVAFSILFFFGTTSVVSNIIFPTGMFIAERVIYLPSLSICLLFGALFYYFYQLGWKKLSIVCFLVILSLASLRTYYRNQDFQGDISFFSAILKVSPKHLKATYALGQSYEAIDPIKAEAYYKKAIEIAPNFSSAYALLATFYFNQGRDSEVLPLVNKAISIAPNSDNAHRVLARYHKKNKDYKKSAESFLIAIKNSPPNAKLEQELAVVLSSLGEKDQAITHFKKAIELDPYFAEPLVNLARIARKDGQLQQANDLLTQALKIEPNNPDANNLWGARLLSEGKLCEAKTYLIKAVTFDIDKQLAEAHSNLGVAYAQMNLYNLARNHFQIALKINPDYLGAKQNLALLDEQGQPTAPAVNCP
ncbi:MAG: tetratricopeptide repeat protein [Acidobacteria bacterium]|nr:tetratricopeptide repeat protein [Acidobacteriota bacterium]